MEGERYVNGKVTDMEKEKQRERQRQRKKERERKEIILERKKKNGTD